MFDDHVNDEGYRMLDLTVFLGRQWTVEEAADRADVRPSQRYRLMCLGETGFEYDLVAAYHRRPSVRDLRKEARMYVEEIGV